MEFIELNFPNIDNELHRYIKDVLENDVEDFNDGNDIFEAIGDVLLQVDNKTEEDIRNVCSQLHEILKTKQMSPSIPIRTLVTPIHLADALSNAESSANSNKSVWMVEKNNTLKVNQKKLAKAIAKTQNKQEKRTQVNKPNNSSSVPLMSGMSAATASQVTSRKDSKLDAKGTNRSKDIRIENFDIAFGDRVLLQNADITLAYGRRYGFVGRNGMGKTTLLRMISSAQLKIPSHIRILHVEQEVVGDDTLALDSVLECDTVRTSLLEKEKQLTAATKNASSDNSDACYELNDLYVQLQNIEADKAPARASVILAGLGFSPEMQRKKTKEFSGGWRMRLALARALFSSPDLLLLDEPTNMLDMKAIIWLENYLQTWPNTLLVVSHDRHFLDTVPTDIMYLHSQRIDCYRGNYELFDKTRKEKQKNQLRELEAQLAQRAHVQEFIDKFRFNASRAASVQSKIKMLDKMPELKAVEKDQEVVLKFPETERLSPPIIQVNEVSFKYPSGMDNVLINVSLSADLDSRICIVGDNGAGKSTLLKLIMGELTPTSGQINIHRNLRFGYFSQHHVDQLSMNISSVELLQTLFPGKSVEEYRRHLGTFGVTGELSLQPIGSLSGGQKSRVAFAKMCLSRPNFLILDEPTNHLDIESIEALGKAIVKYTGGVILVSHDERLIRKVCKELWVCGNKTVKSIEGGFDEYRVIVERELADAK